MIQYLRTMEEELASTDPTRGQAAVGGLKNFLPARKETFSPDPSTVTRETHFPRVTLP